MSPDTETNQNDVSPARPVISVIIPMLNAAKHLDNLIPSLLSQRFDQPWEIIAVDNGSDDRTADVARTLLGNREPEYLIRREVIFVPAPRGYASPRNAGVRLAQSPLLAFCDADGAVDENWLQAMVQALGRHPLVASRKFRSYDVSVRDPDTAWFEQNGLYSMFGLKFAAAAGLGCTHALFDSIGGFDTHFDLGGEDVDFSFRAHFQLGIEPVLEPGAIYWTQIPWRPMKSFLRGFRDGRSLLRVARRHQGELPKSPSGPGARPRRIGRRARRVMRMWRMSRRQMNGVATVAGARAGRIVWSVRGRFQQI